MYRIGWFSSGRGEGSRALLTAMMESIRRGETSAEISFVFCNRERGQTLETDQFHQLVESYGLPLVCLSSQKFRRRLGPEALGSWRLEYDRQVMERLSQFPADI